MSVKSEVRNPEQQPCEYQHIRHAAKKNHIMTVIMCFSTISCLIEQHLNIYLVNKLSESLETTHQNLQNFQQKNPGNAVSDKAIIKMLSYSGGSCCCKLIPYQCGTLHV